MQQQQRASKKQQELLNFVDAFIRESGYGPSYREIMNGLGYKSVSTVAIHIDNLIAKGYLNRRDKSARSLEVVSLSHKDGDVLADRQDDSFEDELTNRINAADLTPEQYTELIHSLSLIGIEVPPQVATLSTKETHA
jgi:SOS-response transcriptional repressor LexA